MKIVARAHAKKHAAPSEVFQFAAARSTTEPLLGPLRRTIPPFGMFDLSALVALIIIWVLQAAVAGTLLRS